jgi:hypothetical protein
VLLDFTTTADVPGSVIVSASALVVAARASSPGSTRINTAAMATHRRMVLLLSVADVSHLLPAGQSPRAPEDSMAPRSLFLTVASDVVR